MTNKFIIPDQAAFIQSAAIAELVNDLSFFYPKKDLVGLSIETLIELRNWQLIKAGVSL